uniref:Uncharacterized protein n=1 Tax=viral metagenome TaxID=1070528 RepID=A0A6C0EDU0_9ZZZZ
MTHYKKISIRKKHSKTRSNKNKSRKQRLWKMNGCAKRANMRGGCATCGCGTPANNNMMMTGGCGCGAQANNMMMGGGVCAGDILAYSPDYKYSCNDNLAYSGKGGRVESNFLTKKRSESQSQFIDNNLPMLFGGGGTCNSDNMPSGGLYPSGAMGSPWTSNPSTWPGVAGVQGSTNYLAYNNYPYPQADRMLMNTEAIPFKYGGKSKKHTFRKHMRKYKTNKNKKNQKGGLPSLGILTELKNTWNTLRGNNQIASPLPFNNQLENQNQQDQLNI